MSNELTNELINKLKVLVDHYPYEYREEIGKIIDKLIKHKINLNDITVNEWPLISHFAYAGIIELIRKLLENNVNIDITDSSNRSALSIACERYAYCTNYEDKCVYEELIMYLVESGADCNMQSLISRETILMKLCRPGNLCLGPGRYLDLLKLILDHGANIASVNYMGQTAEMILSDENCDDIADFIRDYKPNDVTETKGVFNG